MQSLLLVLLTVMVYANSVDNGFHFDDHHSVERNPAIRSLSQIPGYFLDAGDFSADPDVSMYRPTLLISYAINYAVGGGDPIGYHVVNVLLHVGFVLLVWQIARRLCGARKSVLWAVAVLAVHPLNSQAVNYVSSRSGIMAALGALAALYLSVLTRQPRSLAAGASQLAGLLAKSTALSGLGLAAIFELGRGGTRQLGAWRWKALATLGGATGIYVGATWASGFYGAAFDGLVRPLAVQGMTQAKALAYYVYLIASPVHLSIAHPFAESEAASAVVVFAAGLSLSLLALGGYAWRRGEIAGFGVLWFYGGLLLTSLMPLYILVSEHRLYLSLAGLTLLGGRIHRCLPLWIPACLVMILAGLTMQRNGVWQEELSLWADAAKWAPENPRVWSGLGEARHGRGEIDSAFVAYKQALHLQPDNATSWNNLGVLHEETGGFREAEAAYREALRLRDDWPEAQANLGRLLLQSGDTEEAATLLSRSATRSPSVGVLVNLGVAAAREGDVELSGYAFSAALRLQPTHVDARVNLASLRLEQALQTTEPGFREEHLSEAAKLLVEILAGSGMKGHRQAELNLAAVYAAQGKVADSRRLYEALIDRQPPLSEALEAYGRMLLRMGDPGAADVLRRRTKLVAPSAINWQELGQAEAARGRWTAACSAFEAAALLQPGEPGPLYNLAEIRYRRWQVAEERGDPGVAELLGAALAAYAAVEFVEPGFRGTHQRLRQLRGLTP